MKRLVKNTQSLDQFSDGPCHIWTVGDKDQTRVFLRPYKDNHHILVDTIKSIKDWCVSPQVIMVPIHFWQNFDPLKKMNIFLAQKITESEYFLRMTSKKKKRII